MLQFVNIRLLVIQLYLDLRIPDVLSLRGSLRPEMASPASALLRGGVYPYSSVSICVWENCSIPEHPVFCCGGAGLVMGLCCCAALMGIPGNTGRPP